jgi:glutamate 5-kinase
LRTLLDLKVIPIINENDTVVTDEIRFGDNDTLGSLVANLIEADALVILTDQRGLYSADPRQDKQARFIDHALAGDAALEKMAGGAGSSVGTGGMLTKVLAAKRASRSGAHTIIASGREVDVLVRLAAGERIGTHLQTTEMKTTARKQWLADHLQLRGKLSLDAGAIKVLKLEGKSLLAIGVTAVEGHFERGEVVACCDADGHEIARGLVNYSSAEALRIMRQPSADIEKILGYVEASELIHRDNLVLM